LLRKFFLIMLITLCSVFALELIARAVLYSPPAITFSRGNGLGELVPQDTN